MNRLLFRQRLNHLREDALRFQNTLCAYETTDAVRYPENFERLGLDMARQAESIACSTRNIVSIFQMNGREQVQSCAAEAQGITVKEQSYGYEVIPAAFDAKTKSSESYRISSGAINLRLKGIYCGTSNLPFGVCSDLVYL